MQIIYTANEEVARGLYNPAYKLLQMLPGRQTKGQLCMQKFHSVMQDLMREVTSANTSQCYIPWYNQVLRLSASDWEVEAVNLHTTSMCNMLTGCYASFSIADMAVDEEQRSAKQ